MGVEVRKEQLALGEDLATVRLRKGGAGGLRKELGDRLHLEVGKPRLDRRHHQTFPCAQGEVDCIDG